MRNNKFGFCLFAVVILLSACNIKAPIKDLLLEENKQMTQEISLSNQKSDTLKIGDFIHTPEFDSISSSTLAIRSIDKNSVYSIQAKENVNEVLHTIEVWKEKKHVTLVAYHKRDTATCRFHFKSYLNNVLFISGEVNHSKLVVMWQNTVLPSRFIEVDEKGLSIFIPKEAKTVIESTLRIFVVNEEGKIEKLALQLAAGQPIIKE